MFEIVEGYVFGVNQGYAALHAKRYAEANGLTLVVVTPPETWEYDAADTEAW